MDKEHAVEKLKANHYAFIEYIDGLSEAAFVFHKEGKWSAGQQLEHICLSVKPLTLAFVLPHFMLRLLFGTANRSSKSYDELVTKYQDKLQKGGRASGRFIPKHISFDQKTICIQKLKSLIQKLEPLVTKYTEKELDTLILPHPLLGKITLREMLYFTAYHVEHHLRLIQAQLKENTRLHSH